MYGQVWRSQMTIIPRVKLNHAWLISWEGTEPWARSDDGRIIMAIINGRRSAKFVREVLWLLDVRAKTPHP